MEILDKLGEAGLLNESDGLPFIPARRGGNSTEAVIDTIVGALQRQLEQKQKPCNVSNELKDQVAKAQADAQAARAEVEAKKEVVAAEPSESSEPAPTVPPASTSVEMLRSGDLLIKRGNEVEIVKAATPNVTESAGATAPYPAQSMLQTHSMLTDIRHVQP